MNAANLLRQILRKGSAEAQQEADKRFWQIMAENGTNKWQGGMPIAARGKRILVGIAPSYALGDLELADFIVSRIAGPCAPRVELFDASDHLSMADLQEYIPGIGNAYQTPMIGVWEDGVQVSHEWGYAGRQLLVARWGRPPRASSAPLPFRPPRGRQHRRIHHQPVAVLH